MAFAEADKTIHQVETQWHYKMMIDSGFTPLDKEKEGFVRSYRYSKGDRIIECTAGSSRDYWNDRTSGESGLWGDLKRHLEKIS
jgi:hypothetical protein